MFKENSTRFGDDSEPIPEIECEAIARRALVAYYALLSPDDIDTENLTVQIEAFAWRNASYRLDLFFSQRPSFLPYNSNYVMAHRMWMRRSGEIIMSEPVYRSPNPGEGPAASAVGPGRRSFYPGNRAFQSELSFIGRALMSAGSLKGAKSGLTAASEFRLDVRGGLNFLKDVGASIVEKMERFTVTHELQEGACGNKFQGAGFGPFTLFEYDIEKSTGKVSPFRTVHFTPPALD